MACSSIGLCLRGLLAVTSALSVPVHLRFFTVVSWAQLIVLAALWQPQEVVAVDQARNFGDLLIMKRVLGGVPFGGVGLAVDGTLRHSVGSLARLAIVVLDDAGPLHSMVIQARVDVASTLVVRSLGGQQFLGRRTTPIMLAFPRPREDSRSRAGLRILRLAQGQSLAPLPGIDRSIHWVNG